MILTFIKLPFVIKVFVLSIFERPLKTGYTDRFNCNDKILTFSCQQCDLKVILMSYKIEPNICALVFLNL